MRLRPTPIRNTTEIHTRSDGIHIPNKEERERKYRLSKRAEGKNKIHIPTTATFESLKSGYGLV